MRTELVELLVKAISDVRYDVNSCIDLSKIEIEEKARHIAARIIYYLKRGNYDCVRKVVKRAIRKFRDNVDFFDCLHDEMDFVIVEHYKQFVKAGMYKKAVTAFFELGIVKVINGEDLEGMDIDNEARIGLLRSLPKNLLRQLKYIRVFMQRLRGVLRT